MSPFRENARGEWLKQAKVYRRIMKVLWKSPAPLPPYKLSGDLVESGLYRGTLKKRDVLSNVKGVLGRMDRASVVKRAGMVPAMKYGTQQTYRLSPYGRLITSLLLFQENEIPGGSGEVVDPEDMRKDILAFVRACRTAGNSFVDFDFRVMLEMIAQGDTPIVVKFFQYALLSYLWDDLRGPTPDWVRYLADMWTTYLHYSEDPGYARSVLKVLDSLEEGPRKVVALYLKTRLELDWFMGTLPDGQYLEAIARGGSSVRVPRSCPKCKRRVVLKKSVQQLYRDMAREARDKCPKCGSILGMVKWIPWYYGGEGR